MYNYQKEEQMDNKDFDKIARMNELSSLSEGIRDIARMLENDENKDTILSMLRSMVALLLETSNQMHDELL